MMLVLLLYAYCNGVFSSRKIVARCETDTAFRVIVGGDIERRHKPEESSE
jgi:transposase